MEIEVHNLSKVYRGKRGLLSMGFSVNQGELVAIVGHNGAGKSTLLKMLASWVIPDEGKVTVAGIELSNRSALVHKIGFVPETPNLHEGFSVQYNLLLFAFLFKLSSSRVEDILQEFKLVPFRRSLVRTLSRGLKQRLSIARSLLADPPILLLDEPTAALDFETTKDIYDLIRRIQMLGKTILFTSHQPQEIRSLATRILVLQEGSLVFDGTPDLYFQSPLCQISFK